jgi:hypothetical protein
MILLDLLGGGRYPPIDVVYCEPETIFQRLPSQLQGTQEKIECLVAMRQGEGCFRHCEEISGELIPVSLSAKASRRYHASSTEVLGLFYKESTATSSEFLKARFPAISTIKTESGALGSRAEIRYANGTLMTHVFQFS